MITRYTFTNPATGFPFVLRSDASRLIVERAVSMAIEFKRDASDAERLTGVVRGCPTIAAAAELLYRDHGCADIEAETIAARALPSHMSRCRVCRAAVPAGHGHCVLCAYFSDGFRAGAEYCDDFEGLTDADADAYAAANGDEAWESYAAAVDERDLATLADAKANYLRGLIKGLRADAAARLDRGCLDCGAKLDPTHPSRYCLDHRC